MSRVITFSQKFPAYHFQKGEPTYFAEKFLKSYIQHDSKCLLVKSMITHSDYVSKAVFDKCDPKHHTIRVIKKRKWKAGDIFSPRVWGDDVNPRSGRKGAYHSKQIIIAPDTKILKVWDIEIWQDNSDCFIGIREDENTHSLLSFGEVAKNDGLTFEELKAWFQLKPNQEPIKAQILCWNDSIIKYD